MDQPVPDSNIKFYSLFKQSEDCHSESSTVPAEDFHLGVFVSFFVRCPAELRSVPGRTSHPSYKTSPVFLSSHSSACLSVPHRSAVLPFCSPRLMLSPDWVNPPPIKTTDLSAPGLRTCIMPVTSHGTGIIYSALNARDEKRLLRAEPGCADNTPTNRTMQSCTHSLYLHIYGLKKGMRHAGVGKSLRYPLIK